MLFCALLFCEKEPAMKSTPFMLDFCKGKLQCASVSAENHDYLRPLLISASQPLCSLILVNDAELKQEKVFPVSHFF